MKKFITTLILLVTAVTTAHAGLFNQGVEAERDRRQQAEHHSQQLEQQLNTQRELTNKWQIATGSLAVSSVILLGIGVAIGAKSRKAVKKDE